MLCVSGVCSFSLQYSTVCIQHNPLIHSTADECLGSILPIRIVLL